jgi:hypothetical protein
MADEVLHRGVRECSQENDDVAPLSKGVSVLCNLENPKALLHEL